MDKDFCFIGSIHFYLHGARANCQLSKFSYSIYSIPSIQCYIQFFSIDSQNISLVQILADL
nr:MAG TPA: hypothetical protein [Caudoviricetes sp.]